MTDQADAGELHDLEANPDEMINPFDEENAKDLRETLIRIIETRLDDMLPHNEPVGAA